MTNPLPFDDRADLRSALDGLEVALKLKQNEIDGLHEELRELRAKLGRAEHVVRRTRDYHKHLLSWPSVVTALDAYDAAEPSKDSGRGLSGTSNNPPVREPAAAQRAGTFSDPRDGDEILGRDEDGNAVARPLKPPPLWDCKDSKGGDPDASRLDKMADSRRAGTLVSKDSKEVMPTEADRVREPLAQASPDCTSELAGAIVGK